MGMVKVDSVKMRINAYRTDEEIEVKFPAGWDITECRMGGHDKPALSDGQIRAALQSPIGTPRLSELAKGAKKVCILFDDMPKPTPVSRMVPFVLEELHAAGVADDQIRFVCAMGTHRPMLYPELVFKLGRDVVEKYAVYNHTCWENLVDLGKTSRGTPVLVNREFASCDLKIAIGSVIPHGQAGFGGGGKIILPGVIGMDTVNHHHKNSRENSELGRVADNAFRLDIEEAARMAGLQFKVDAILNNRREVVALFAGDFLAEHRQAVKEAARVYGTETAENADVVFVNSYPDEVQLVRVMWCAGASLREGGDLVVWSHAPDGQVLHQFSSRFGTDYGGRGWQPDRLPKMQAKAARIILVAPYLTKCEKDDAGLPEKVIHCRDWAEAICLLIGKNGPGTKVAVYPYAPLQMPMKSTKWVA